MNQPRSKEESRVRGHLEIVRGEAIHADEKEFAAFIYRELSRICAEIARRHGFKEKEADVNLTPKETI